MPRKGSMPTMKAFAQPSSGTPTPEFDLVPIPRIGTREMLVRIMAVGVGIHDSYFLPSERTLPFPIGIEAAGVIEEVGSGVKGHKPSDRIAFVSMMQPKGGVWAEYAVVDTDSLILAIPDPMTFEQAAAIPVAANTAVRALHALPHPDPPGSLFVAGASGAVGTFVVQLANRCGWAVAASASPPNHNYLTDLGAEFVVDYNQPSWPSEVLRWRASGVDGAVAIQPNTTASSMGIVKGGGTVVTVSADQDASAHGINVTGLAYSADVGSELETLVNDITMGTIKLVIEQIYPFAEAARALAKVQTRHARGKIVLSMG